MRRHKKDLFQQQHWGERAFFFGPFVDRRPTVQPNFYGDPPTGVKTRRNFSTLYFDPHGKEEGEPGSKGSTNNINRPRISFFPDSNISIKANSLFNSPFCAKTQPESFSPFARDWRQSLDGWGGNERQFSKRQPTNQRSRRPRRREKKEEEQQCNSLCALCNNRQWIRLKSIPTMLRLLKCPRFVNFLPGRGRLPSSRPPQR